MTQDKKDDRKIGKDEKTRKRSDTSSSVKDIKSDTDCLPTKIVIRRLPPSWNADIFLEQVAPVPDNDYFYFVPADMSLGQNAFSRAYLNLVNRQDISIFMEKFDGYVFVDSKGLEYPAIVEFAPFSKVPKRRPKKSDPRKGTIEADVDYLKFLSQLQNTEHEAIPTPDTILEEIETREKQLKENVLVSTPLIEFIIKRREEKKMAIVQAQQAREDKRRKELERRKREEEMRFQERERLREKEKQKQREKEERAKRKEEQARNSVTAVPTQAPVKLLKNPEREKEHEQQKDKSDVSKTTDGGRSKLLESSRKTSRDYESERRDKNATSRQSVDSRPSSQTYRKVSEEGDDRGYGHGRHTQSAAGRPRQDRSHREKEPEDQQPKQVVEKRLDKVKEQTEPTSDNKGESEKPKPDEKDGESKDNKSEQSVKPKVTQQTRDERRTKQDDSRGGREYRDGRYSKDRRDVRYAGDTKDYKEKDRRSERDERDYKDKERRDYRDKDDKDRKIDKDVKYKESKTSSQRETGVDHGNRGQGSSRRDDATVEKSRIVDDRHGDRKPGSGGSGVRHNSVEFAESETASRSSKEKTPDHESSPVVSHSSKGHIADRRSSEKESHRSDASNRQRIRYKDRPERAIYNPGKRAVERKKEEPSSRTDDGEQLHNDK